MFHDLTQITSLEERVGQMMAVGFEGLTAPDYLLEWLAQGRAGTVILFARNVESPEQLAALTRSLHAAAKYPLLIGIDQEGGTVARLRDGFTESPGAMALAAASSDNEARTARVSKMLAEEMRAVGINWDYAPAVDMAYIPSNPTVGTRSFGVDPETVASLAAAAVTGFEAGGVATSAKHFPGLGKTAIDTHVALPTLDTPVEQLMERDLLPFRTAIDAGASSIMTTHTIFATLDAELPVTLSPVVIRQLLRDTLGFRGVVTTDCMEMKAIADNYGTGESAILAALADVDTILFSHTRATQAEAFEAVCAAVRSGRIPPDRIETALVRISALKARKAITGDGDLGSIRSAEHLAIAEEAARAGTILYKGKIPSPPTPSPTQAGRGEEVGAEWLRGAVVVEFASVLESGILESGGLTGLSRALERKLAGTRSIALNSKQDDAALNAAVAQVQTAELLVLATRNAHLMPGQLAQAKALMQAAKRTVMLALRNPYDAAVLPDAEIIICTCGDSAPSLESAVDALLGTFTPTGRLPVPLDNV
jgi:beta-N-acetylhexosaminidase